MEDPMIIQNYSHLTEVQRVAILSAGDPKKQNSGLCRVGRQSTVDALVRLGLGFDGGSRWFKLNAAGYAAYAALSEPKKAIPAKVATYLERAQKLGLDTHESEPSGTLRSWTISSPNPIDNTQIWIYWTAGARGGRLGFTVWLGSSSKRHVTRRYAWVTLSEMGDSLQRHLAREAARAKQAAAATADVRHGADVVASHVAAKLEDCGCPTEIVTAEGHQEGCPVDPSRPGWFLEGQHIYDHQCGTWFRVGIVQTDRAGRVDAVAVSVNGGYGGRLSWYGKHPEAVGPLSLLESRHVGLTDADRRTWPASDRSAALGIGQVLTDQKLSGWAMASAAGPRVIVNIPDGTDPERHLTLLRRYVPYLATVELRNNGLPRNHYPTIQITPREV